jgi:DNA-binding response OmpR family regulator
MRNQGRIIPKDIIIEHVWDYDAEVMPNSVEVYMRHLRRKVDEGFTPPLLHTVRGFGYKLEAV